jgi:hypothetical protein
MLVNRHMFSLMAVCLTVSLAADAAVMDRWHAGTWDSTAYSRAEHPKTVAIRMELLDKDTHIPISGVQVSLRGEYWQMWVSQDIVTAKDVPWWNILVDPDKREPQPREFRLDAVSGPDGVVVFALPWQKEFPWDTKIGDKWTYKVGDQWIVYVDDIEKVQRLEIRHPQYKYFDSPLDFKHLVGLEQYIEARKSGENIQQKFEARWKGEISRKNVKLFVLDLGPEFGEFRKQACQRPEFFQKVRVKDYGLIYRDVENLWNLQGETKCGPYFVYDLGEVLLEPVAVRVSVGPAGNNILTREDNQKSTPRPSRPAEKADNATVSGQGAEQVRDTSPTQTPSPVPAATLNTRTEEGSQYVAMARNDPLGVAVTDLKKDRAQSLGLPPTVATNFAGTEGLIVEYVAPGSLASEVGLKRDCILTIMWIDGYEKHLFDDKDYRDAVDLISKKRAENLRLQYWQFPVPFNGEIDYPNHLKTVEIYLDPDKLPAAFRSGVAVSQDRSAATASTPQQPRQEPQALKSTAPALPKLALPSLDELKADAAKLRALTEKASAMKGQLAVTAIRALPMPDPDTGQMTTLDAYARKLAANAGVGGSLGEDPVATAYMMLFDSSFLTDQARIIKLPDGKYVPLVEAIGIATGKSAPGLDPGVLSRALSAVTDLQQAQRAGNGELLAKALTKLFFAVSEANVEVPSQLAEPLVAGIKKEDEKASTRLLFQVQASLPLDFKDLIVGPHARYVVYVHRAKAASNSANHRVLVNGQPETVYSWVGDIVFSLDGEHYAYQARRLDGRYCIVADGKEGPLYDYVSRPAFRDSGKILYLASTKGEGNCIIIGDRTAVRDAQIVCFAANGKGQFLYLLPDGKGYRIMRDSVELCSISGRGPTGWDYRATGCMLSPDGNRFVIQYKDDLEYFLKDGYCFDGKLVCPGRNLRFAPDWSRYVYERYESTGTRFDPIWIQETILEGVGKIEVSPDQVYLGSGGHYAYTSPKGLTVDGRLLPDCKDGKVKGASPDGKRIAYSNRNGLYVDSELVGQYAVLGPVLFSDNGADFACICRKANGKCVVLFNRNESPEFASVDALALHPLRSLYACRVRNRAHAILIGNTPQQDFLYVTEPLFDEALAHVVYVACDEDYRVYKIVADLPR